MKIVFLFTHIITNNTVILNRIIMLWEINNIQQINFRIMFIRIIIDLIVYKNSFQNLIITIVLVKVWTFLIENYWIKVIQLYCI